jgi:hypothetical protein
MRWNEAASLLLCILYESIWLWKKEITHLKQKKVEKTTTKGACKRKDVSSCCMFVSFIFGFFVLKNCVKVGSLKRLLNHH